jgi:hypothetical protein
MNADGSPEGETTMSDGGDVDGSGDEFESVEVESIGTDAEGNLVIDDVVVLTDRDGHVVAVDETIAVVDAYGDAAIDEVVSAVGEDGELHVVEEDVTVIDGDQGD